MDEKVIEVIRTMIVSPKLMGDIHKAAEEYYFKYKNHQFSIRKRSESDTFLGPYTFYVYPKWSGPSIALAQELDLGNAENIEVISYHANIFKQDDTIFLAKLYRAVEEQYSNVDFIFDDILSIGSVD